MGHRQKIAFHRIFGLRFQRCLLSNNPNLKSKKIFLISKIILLGNEAAFFVTDRRNILELFPFIFYVNIQ
jgi:hypothetical protein